MRPKWKRRANQKSEVTRNCKLEEPKEPVKCYSCGKTGHYLKNCQARKEDETKKTKHGVAIARNLTAPMLLG